MLALVTGGGGFLGRAIVEQLLDRGYQVRSIGRGAYPELEALGVEVVRADLRDSASVADACQGIDCVFHTAALAGIWGTWNTYHQINVQGTLNVLAGCRQQQVPRLVYTSSPSVTFDGFDQCGCNEEAPYATCWLAHYPHSKALAEQAVLTANGKYDLTTCALRPHLIWGPRDGHLVPRLIQRARSGRLRRVGCGTNRIDIIYIENAAIAHLQAADVMRQHDSPVAGKAYFLSQGEPVNCWQWIDQLLELASLPPVQKSVSLATARRVGAIFEGLYGALRLPGEPPMTRFLAAQLGLSHWFNISAAQQDFGYQPQVTTAEGMRRLGDWLDQTN
ncbi:MAG: NAD-dependent epimerase/dehydratase family protein [Pirellulales bacterium]